MNYKEFIEKFRPLPMNANEGIEQYYIPSKWPDARIILKYPNCALWTVLKEEGLVIKPDLHFKDKVATIITEIPWKEKDKQLEIKYEKDNNINTDSNISI